MDSGGIDLDLVAVAAAFVLAVLLALLRRLLRGRAVTPWWTAVGVAAWSFVALTLVTAGSYWLMNARTFQVAR